ncbi:MAG: hypothetical protein HY905_26005 [Deltaproteobacteria bacterium]|nr:hypothetical protein [Deltaproteobacteria bacterium]
MSAARRNCGRFARLVLASSAALATPAACSLDWTAPHAADADGSDTFETGDVPLDDARPDADADAESDAEGDAGDADGDGDAAAADADAEADAADADGDAADADATDGGCTGPADCPDDGNPCDGVEFCDPASSACAGRDAPPEGTPCGSGYACAGGLCIPVTCGDDVRQDPEECDDGRNGDPDDGCRDDCTFSCHGDPDCADRFVCNGAETCGSEHRCVAGTPAPAGTSCHNDRWCDGPDHCDGSGGCRADGTPECVDGQECTDDLCDDSTDTCSNPPLADGTACGGGRCCGGGCRGGATCCSDVDCPMACQGTAASCADIGADHAHCAAQAGCTVEVLGECAETGGRTCNFTDGSDCTACGCDWDSGSLVCSGSGGPMACPSAWDQPSCERCGCLWSTTLGGCLGTATSCPSLDTDPACTAQWGCRWDHRTCDGSYRCG